MLDTEVLTGGGTHLSDPKDPLRKPRDYALSLPVAELLFVMLPLLVLLFVSVYLGKGVRAFFGSPEWAFATALLFGKATVSYVVGMTQMPHGDSLIAHRVGLIVASLIVCGLVPSMVVLALVLLSTAAPVWLVLVQVGLFLVSAFIFLTLNYVTNLVHASKARER
jgi:hypothetical protein